MFRIKRHNYDGPRPVSTYLLPSFPSLDWIRKVSAATAQDPTSLATSPRESIALPSAAPIDTDHDYFEAVTDSHRFSVASAASSASAATVTSTGTQATAPSLSTSLSTSPSSDISVTPQSLFGGPIAAPFPIFDTIDYQQAGFAAFHNDDGPLETGVAAPSSMYKSGPQVETLRKQNHPPASSPQTQTQTAAPSAPARHIQRVFPTTLRCRRCAADLAFAAQVVSKGFTGRHGRAYLVSAPATSPRHLFAPEVKEARGDREDDDDDDDDVDDDDDDDDDDEGGGRALRLKAGRARDLPNILIGRSENRRLVTGAHVVADIYCAVCRSKLGWKYVDASDPAQRYKVGKFILEIARLATYHSWEDVPLRDARGSGGADRAGGADEALDTAPSPISDPLGAVRQLMARYQRLRTGEATADVEEEGDFEDDGDGDSDIDLCYPKHSGPIEFDSDDEDECEEIFMGTWDADVVARRRAAKRADLLLKSFKT